MFRLIHPKSNSVITFWACHKPSALFSHFTVSNATMNQLQKLKHEIAQKYVSHILGVTVTFLLMSRYDIFVGDLRLYNEYMFLFFSFCCFNTLVLLTFMSVSSLKYLKLNVNISWVLLSKTSVLICVSSSYPPCNECSINNLQHFHKYEATSCSQKGKTDDS